MPMEVGINFSTNHCWGFTGKRHCSHLPNIWCEWWPDFQTAIQYWFNNRGCCVIVYSMCVSKVKNQLLISTYLHGQESALNSGNFNIYNSMQVWKLNLLRQIVWKWSTSIPPSPLLYPRGNLFCSQLKMKNIQKAQAHGLSCEMHWNM